MSADAADHSVTSGHRVPDDDPARPQAISWAHYVDAVLAEWHGLLATEPEEAEVQAFLEHHPAMVPGGSGDIGPGGHHGSDLSAVFCRPPLIGNGRTFVPDFMWVTRSSGLITPILIEIEKPSKRWFKDNGRPTSDFRDAHDQLNDWRAWFAADQNASIFRDEYLINGDRYESRPLEPHFVLIYGRQLEFEHGGGHRDPDALRRKRDTQRAGNEAFMTFDSLRPRFDHANSVTVAHQAKGNRAIAFSPVYGTSTSSGSTALLLDDVEAALAHSAMMSGDRRAYLGKRLEYWKSVEVAERSAKTGPAIRQLGLE
jgi:Domain of unknown function (DUF4263)